MEAPAATLAPVLCNPPVPSHSQPSRPFPLLQLMTLAERSQGEESSDTGELKNAEELHQGGMHVGERIWILIATREKYTESGGGGVIAEYMLTGILIAVQVLASSQSEAETRHAASGGPSGPQLLAHRQALGQHVPVAVEDQHTATALLTAERTADRHVCSSDGTNRGWFSHQRPREACR